MDDQHDMQMQALLCPLSLRAAGCMHPPHSIRALQPLRRQRARACVRVWCPNSELAAALLQCLPSPPARGWLACSHGRDTGAGIGSESDGLDRLGALFVTVA